MLEHYKITRKSWLTSEISNADSAINANISCDDFSFIEIITQKTQKPEHKKPDFKIANVYNAMLTNFIDKY